MARKAQVYDVNGVPVVACSEFEAYLVLEWASALCPRDREISAEEADKLLKREIWWGGLLEIQVVATWALWFSDDTTTSDLRKWLGMVNKVMRLQNKWCGAGSVKT